MRCARALCRDLKSSFASAPFCALDNFSPDHFDLSTQAFEQLAPLELGHINMVYRRVSCDATSPIVLQIDQNTNSWWMAMRVKNVGSAGNVAKLEIMEPKSVGGSGNWQKMTKSWGATWGITHLTSDHHGKPFMLPMSVRITLNVTWQTAVLNGVIKAFSCKSPQTSCVTCVHGRGGKPCRDINRAK